MAKLFSSKTEEESLSSDSISLSVKLKLETSGRTVVYGLEDELGGV